MGCRHYGFLEEASSFSFYLAVQETKFVHKVQLLQFKNAT